MKLDNPESVRILLEEISAINAMREAGDHNAFAIVEDVRRAMTLGKLTDSQRTAVELVFFQEHSQVEAGKILGKSRGNMNHIIKAAVIKIAMVFESWAHVGDGYSVEEVEAVYAK